jgi:NAD(P)-dependent dehydrogenase (short-subunit alcohol dehydrogenase family)
MKILVLGATSAIVESTCLALAKQSLHEVPSFYLVGRNPIKLERVANALRDTRSAVIADYEVADLTRLESIAAIVQRAHSAMGRIDGALIGHGILPNQAECEKDTIVLSAAVDTDFSSAAVALNVLAEVIEPNGVIAVISSVAGDTSSPSSALYCALKAALSRYIQGLRGKLWAKRVKLVDVRPGWVDTPLIAHLKKNPLFATPETVGADIARALRRRSPSVLYTPWWWAALMAPIKLLPNALYKYVKR